MEYLRLCQGEKTKQFKATILVQTITGLTVKINKFPNICYNREESGHTQKKCQIKTKIAPAHLILLLQWDLNNLGYVLGAKK